MLTHAMKSASNLSISVVDASQKLFKNANDLALFQELFAGLDIEVDYKVGEELVGEEFKNDFFDPNDPDKEMRLSVQGEVAEIEELEAKLNPQKSISFTATLVEFDNSPHERLKITLEPNEPIGVEGFAPGWENINDGTTIADITIDFYAVPMNHAARDAKLALFRERLKALGKVKILIDTSEGN